MCGEKVIAVGRKKSGWGSPPRVWGKGQRLLAKNPEFGITPACAGKRMVFAGRKSRTWDHPRVCGEKVSSTSPIKCLKGSPPRMRGKETSSVWVTCLCRITPAYAGKRLDNLQRPSSKRDHPRVCGEKLPTPESLTERTGSPPRMRGKVSTLLLDYTSNRITPAYAGKSLGRIPNEAKPWDHPRVCGEK